MRAALFKAYGNHDSIQVQEIEQPPLGDNDILIKVIATTVTAVDAIFLSGKSLFPRLATGLLKPKIPVLGTELSGIVEAVGQKVTNFKPGDEVIADSGTNYGAHGEYVRVSKDDPIVQKPQNVPFKEAAAISYGSLTALSFLRDSAKVKEGNSVLIIGASGSVGTYAIQIAKQFGANVTGVCSTKNVALVTSLGADHVIDYTQTALKDLQATYDIVFDTVGKYSFGSVRHLLSPKGRYLTTVLSFRAVFDMALSTFRRQKSILALTGLRPAAQKLQDLQFVTDLFSTNSLQSVVDREYALDNIAEAFRYVQLGHKSGNVVVSINNA